MPITKTQGKKDGLQRYRVRVNYTDAQGQHRQRERIVYGLPEAKEAERKMMIEVSSAPALRMTVADLCADCMLTKSKETRESTQRKFDKNLRLYVVPYIGTLRVDKISVPKLQEWKNAISDLPLSVSTKRDVYKSLSSVFNYAVRLGYMDSNPLPKVGNFVDVMLETVSVDMSYYTADEFLTYIGVARERAVTPLYWGYYTFFAIAYYTGMRKGEINALKWTDIEGNIIKVRRSVNLKSGEGDIETPLKNASSIRNIQAPLPLLKILAEQRAVQEKDPRFSDNWRVCGGPSFLRDTSMDKANRRYATAAGLKRIRIHDFRHSHASLLCNEGINIQEIARRLGHSDVQTTWRIYAHLYPREEERALQILNNIGANSGQ